MKIEIIIASIAPVLWIGFAIWQVGTPVAPPPANGYETGQIVVAMAVLVVPTAIIAYLAGQCSKGE